MNKPSGHRPKWSVARLAYTDVQRSKIMACIQRLNDREHKALAAAVIRYSYSPGYHGPLSQAEVRSELRAWFYQRWLYLVGEYEKVLPHVENLPLEEDDD